MIEVLRADITTLDVDAIVNAANPGLSGGAGVDGAIHRAAGPELARAAMAFAPCPPGEAVLTEGFELKARHVIHVVGPIWRGGMEGEAVTLGRAYERAFEVALAQGTIRSIAFPAISTGAYGYPKLPATEIAVAVMRAYEDRFERVIACVFDEATAEVYKAVLGEEG
jgi:O-acetyl-ADP-ribose deacetylase